MFKRVYFGDVTNDNVRTLSDINVREFAMLGVLAAATLWMGLYPKPFTDTMHVSVNGLLTHVATSKLPTTAAADTAPTVANAATPN
jgi:NADH-quinone oxidoreductase subunit M